MYLPDKDYSPETARIIDEEVKRLIDEAYQDATRMIDEHWDKVEAIAQALLKYETLQSDEVTMLMDGQQIDRPTVADLLDSESKSAPTPPPAADDRPDEAGGMMPSPA